MDTHSYKCPGCGGALLYDVRSKKLLCDYCCEAYNPEEVPEPVQAETGSGREGRYGSEPGAYGGRKHGTETEPYDEEYGVEENGEYEASRALDETDFMEVRIYHCGSCGAEVMTNDVEVAKMCSYCGQPAILFDRVSRERRPAKILPFRIDKRQAVEKARERFAGARFLPVEAKNISTEQVHAIYFPYYCYDASMQLDIAVTFRGNNGKVTTRKQGSLRRKVLLDASRKFNDAVSKTLNPFPIDEAVAFSESYLSGFFADRSDVEMASRKADAEEYVQNLLQEKLIAQVPGAPSLYMRQMYSGLYDKTGFACDVNRKEYQLHGSEYVFCPVYFITFKIGRELVILLVNGCTGKVVGNIPIDEAAFGAAQKKNSIICAVLFGIVGAVLFRFVPVWWAGMLFAILAGFTTLAGVGAKNTYEKMRKEMSSASMFDLTRNR